MIFWMSTTEIGSTPAKGSCCPSDTACAPDPALWTAPTWHATTFEVLDKHYYSYEHSGVDASSTEFTVTAYGDLDCDGNYSTYSLTATKQGDSWVEGPIVETDPLE